LHFVGAAVTVFGSARVTPDSATYEQARQLARALGSSGFAIITGGGPGVMEAANRGARDAGAKSIGCTIKLPFEEAANPHLDVQVDFHYFFTRKYMLTKYSSAFVVFPGGFGTADELFEALTLIQTGKMHDFPVVVCGGTFWRPLQEQLEMMADAGMIARRDLDLLKFTDDIDEALQHITQYAARGGKTGRPPRKLRILGERRG
ncbi:MAG: TIGR00730 family Rossman fold protein, partial [Ilumatobacteraceae bacterium]